MTDAPPLSNSTDLQFADANGLIVNRLHVTPGLEGDTFKVDLG